MINTPNLGQKVTIYYKNLSTGVIRTEVLRRVEINGSTVYVCPKGHYYTHGILGWYNVDKHIN